MNQQDYQDLYQKALCKGPEAMGRLLIISTSKIHGSLYLEYLLPELRDFLKGLNELVFIPYARPGGISHDEYTSYPRKALKALGIKVRGIHEFEDPKAAIAQASAIFVGGGNTFLLLQQLYEQELLDPIRAAVAQGCAYMGSSAGSNVAGLSIGTTNDMPIVAPPQHEALALLPFNLNPHYLDPDPESRHMGETREARILEFLSQNPQPVLGLREGSWLRLEAGQLSLKGPHSARLFAREQSPREIAPGEINFLLQAAGTTIENSQKQ